MACPGSGPYRRLWGDARGFDLNKAGFVIVGLFVMTWAISVWRFAHIEEKWSAGQRAKIPPTDADPEGIGPPATNR